MSTREIFFGEREYEDSLTQFFIASDNEVLMLMKHVVIIRQKFKITLIK